MARIDMDTLLGGGGGGVKFLDVETLLRRTTCAVMTVSFVRDDGQSDHWWHQCMSCSTHLEEGEEHSEVDCIVNQVMRG
jgi:hypothetical protein